MQRILQGAALMGVIGLAIASFSLATDRPETRPGTSPAIQGELIKMEGELFTVKDPTGRKQQLRINRDTKLVGVFKTGDYVQAWVLPDGRTESIIAFKKDMEPGQGLPPQP